MTDVNLDSPEIQSAIAAKAQEQAESMAKELAAKQLEGMIPASEIEGLKNKNSELLGKMAKYKDLNDDDLEKMRLLKKQAESDEIAKMAQEGRFEEMRTSFIKSYAEEAANEKAELAKQLEVAQQTAAAFEDQVKAKDSEIVSMYKETFVNDLLRNDDSFKAGKESQFMKIYGDSIEFDPEGRTFYALKDGERVINADGNHVKFGDYLSTIKKTDDLFFNGGSGSGLRHGSGDGAIGTDPRKWSRQDKIQYIQENGQKAYSELLSKAK